METYSLYFESLDFYTEVVIDADTHKIVDTILTPKDDEDGGYLIPVENEEDEEFVRKLTGGKDAKDHTS